MTWQSTAAQHIDEIARELPKNTTLADRRKILCEAGNDFARGSHWPRKAWAKAQRAHMERHGQPKGYGKRKPNPTGDELPLAPKPEPKGSLL